MSYICTAQLSITKTETWCKPHRTYRRTNEVEQICTDVRVGWDENGQLPTVSKVAVGVSTQGFVSWHFKYCYVFWNRLFENWLPSAEFQGVKSPLSKWQYLNRRQRTRTRIIVVVSDKATVSKNCASDYYTQNRIQNSTEQNASSEASTSSARQELTLLSWNLTAYLGDHTISTLVPLLINMTPIHILPSYRCTTFSFKFCHQNSPFTFWRFAGRASQYNLSN